jgi:hypothetical protein
LVSVATTPSPRTIVAVWLLAAKPGDAIVALDAAGKDPGLSLDEADAASFLAAFSIRET